MIAALPRRLGPWCRNRRGSAAIEFALLVPVYLIMLFGILESAVLLVNEVVMEGSAQEAARQIRTGSVQQAADPVAQFRTLLCANVQYLMPCAGLIYDVRSFPNFSVATIAPLYDDDGNPLPTQFSTGQAGDIVVVRVSRTWSFVTPLLAHAYGTAAMKLTTTVVFRNEPYR